MGFSKESSYFLTLLMGLNPEEVDSIIQALEATQVFSSHPAFYNDNSVTLKYFLITNNTVEGPYLVKHVEHYIAFSIKHL